MAPRIGFDNLARRAGAPDDAPAVATAGSTASGSPASRILTAALSECWRSGTGVYATWLQVVLPEPGEIDTVALVRTNLQPTATWRVRIGTGDLTDAGNVVHDTGTVSAGVVDPWALAVLYLDAAVSGDTVRIDLEDTALTQLEVPRIWVGQSRAMDRWYSFGFEERWRDLSTRSESTFGNDFVDERPLKRGYRLTFEAMTNEDAAHIREMFRQVGASREILISLDEERAELGANTVLVLPTMQPLVARAPRLWSWTLDCEERQ